MIQLPILITYQHSKGFYEAVLIKMLPIKSFEMILTSAPQDDQKLLGSIFSSPADAIQKICHTMEYMGSGWSSWTYGEDEIRILDIVSNTIPAPPNIFRSELTQDCFPESLPYDLVSTILMYDTYHSLDALVKRCSNYGF